MQHLYVFDLKDLVRATRDRMTQSLLSLQGNPKDLRKWYEWQVTELVAEFMDVKVTNFTNLSDSEAMHLRLAMSDSDPLFRNQVYDAMDLQRIPVLDTDAEFTGVFDGRHYYLIQCSDI